MQPTAQTDNEDDGSRESVAIIRAGLGGHVLYVRDQGSTVINTDPEFWAREPEAGTGRADPDEFIASWNAAVYARDEKAGDPPPPGMWVVEAYQQKENTA